MLAKAKSPAQQKQQNKESKKVDTPVAKKARAENTEKLSVEKKPKGPPKKEERAPDGIKDRLWDIVGKWF